MKRNHSIRRLLPKVCEGNETETKCLKDRRRYLHLLKEKFVCGTGCQTKTKTGFMAKTDFNEMVDTFISEYKLDDKTVKKIRSWLVDGWDVS